MIGIPYLTLFPHVTFNTHTAIHLAFPVTPLGPAGPLYDMQSLQRCAALLW